MRTRKNTKLIEIWQTTDVPDVFGGNTVESELITKSWAEVKTASSSSRYVQRMVDLGVIDPTNAIILRLRKRNDITYNAINQYVMYRGVRYVIQTEPTEVDFTGNIIEIIAARDATREVAVISPIVLNVFDPTFDPTFN